MSRPPKPEELINQDTIYTDRPSYDPYERIRAINNDRHTLPIVDIAESENGHNDTDKASSVASSNVKPTAGKSKKNRESTSSFNAGKDSNRGNSPQPQNDRRNSTVSSVAPAPPPVADDFYKQFDDKYQYNNKKESNWKKIDINNNDRRGDSDAESDSSATEFARRNKARHEEEQHLIVSGGHNNDSDNETSEKENDFDFYEKSFFSAMGYCFCHPCNFAVEWCSEMGATFAFSKRRLADLSWKDIGLFFVFLFVLTCTQMMSVFGFNFWLHSFSKGNPTYMSIVLPSVIYAVVNFLMIPLFLWKQLPGESLLFWTGSWESILMLIAIGVADSVAGMTSTYAVPHIPVIVQTSVSSCGAIFVYILHRFLYKKTALPFSFLLLVCFLFLLGAVACSVAPIYLEGKRDAYLEPKWIGVFVVVIIAPAVYNVVQGRFLGKYAGDKTVPAETAKFVVLTGDYWVQALVSFTYFPLDFTPGFGPSPNAEHAWEKAKEALECVTDCENNWIYLVLYTAGFWSGRILRTIMNMYSPTMGQFVMQLMGPIKAFAIVLFPALNLKGKSQDPAYNAGTFGALIIATLFYLLANEQNRMKQERRRRTKETGEGTASEETENRVAGAETANIGGYNDYTGDLYGVDPAAGGGGLGVAGMAFARTSAYL